MKTWNVYWMQGGLLRVTHIFVTDAYSIVQSAAGQGVDVYSIFKIEQVAQ